jgi:hypothetical protein
MKETPEAFEDEVKRLNDLVSKIPDLGETDNLPRHPFALHYFLGRGDFDWYICEWDREDPFFGYAILNDFQNSEWGYISRQEILSLEIPKKLLMINLDLHCDEKFIEDALFKKNPKQFWKYGSGTEKDT